MSRWNVRLLVPPNIRMSYYPIWVEPYPNVQLNSGLLFKVTTFHLSFLSSLGSIDNPISRYSIVFQVFDCWPGNRYMKRWLYTHADVHDLGLLSEATWYHVLTEMS